MCSEIIDIETDSLRKGIGDDGIVCGGVSDIVIVQLIGDRLPSCSLLLIADETSHEITISLLGDDHICSVDSYARGIHIVIQIDFIAIALLSDVNCRLMLGVIYRIFVDDE